MAILTRSFSDELEKIALTMPSRGARPDTRFGRRYQQRKP
jgi:hypothetical protein